MRRDGFMLVELAVAALIIGVGILVLLGIGQAGSQAAADIEDETRAALFADDVFATLRVFSDHYSRGTNSSDWATFWAAFGSGDAELPLASAGTWAAMPETGRPPTIMASADRSRVFTNVFIRPQPAVAGAAFPEYGVQYRLALDRPSTDHHSVPLLPLDTNDPPRSVFATLHVWSGLQRTRTEPFAFYTHFPAAGGLP